MIRSFKGLAPRIDPTAFVEASAQVIGDVTIGPRSSIWFNCVVRGDVEAIRIGTETNVQDLSVLHVLNGRASLSLGDRVSIAHGVVLHGCTVRSGSLVGIGSVIMDGAEVGEECLVAACSFLTHGTKVPPRSLVMGWPADVKRPLRPEELDLLRQTAANYVEYAQAYRAELPT